jgi:Cu-processing system ATP-binding protein
MTTNIVQLDAVSKTYAKRAVVQDVSLSISAGECVALLGHNGAGKTTLIKLLLGLVRPDSGRIMVFGEQVNGHRMRQNDATGFLAENVAFPNAMTGAQVLTFYAKLKGEPRSVVLPMLERVGLAGAENQRVGTYSKGMRQRLGLAQALLGEARLLLLDEPTSGLDPVLRGEFYRILSDLQRVGVGALICSHTLTEIESRADRLAIMKQGRLVACGTLAELAREAAIPVHIRVATVPGEAGVVAEHVHQRARVEKVNERVLDLSCFDADKMSLLRVLSNLDQAVEDVDVTPPRLEEIYAHFTGIGDA